MTTQDSGIIKGGSPIGGVTWSNIDSSGTATFAPNDATQLLMTVPLTTGAFPLGAGLWAFVWVSWRAFSADAGKFSLAKRVLLAAVQGDATPANHTVWPASNYAAMDRQGERFDAPAALGIYFEIHTEINGSGDLEFSLVCRSTDNASGAGVAWTFSDFDVEYRIVGNP